MRNRTISWVTVLVMLLTVALAHGYHTPANRYYQHLEAAPKPPCQDHGSEVFCTHLPLLNITTVQPMPDPYHRDAEGKIKKLDTGRPDFNNDMVAASVEVFDSPEHNNHLTDEPVLKARALTRIRGNSSRHFLKKNYLLKFRQENLEDNRNVSLLGMTPDHNWVLHGPFMDRTLLRNYLCCHLAGEIMDYAPDVRFCELFLNGEYMGVYLAMEKINFNPDGRVSLTPTDPRMAATSYILKLDTGDTDPLHQLTTFCDLSGKRGLKSRKSEHYEVIYPGRSLTQEQKQYIERQLSAFEKSLFSFDFDDPDRGYPAYLDVDSFINFMLLSEFTMNTDAGTLSTYYCKDLRGKIQIIGWDYNNTFNNYFMNMANPHSFYTNNTWYSSLLRDDRFVEKAIKRYRELRKTVFSDEALFQLIDDTVAYLGPAIDRNTARWIESYPQTQDGIEGERYNELALLDPFDRCPRTYEEAVAYLKQMISEHGRFLDENIESLRSRSHDSTNKQFKLQEGDFS